MKTTRGNKGSHPQRGSALLVALMVMVGLSLLGLGFVSVSETESAISVNQRNYAQVLSLAEAGAKAAVEWFQDPEDMDNMGLLPPNHANLKRARTLGGANVGTYKGGAGELLFDKPFKPAVGDKLYGDQDHADVFIDRSTAQGQTFLDTFNSTLFGNNLEGEITEILVYAPPVVGATLNAQGFYEGGVRYGLATIRATATKWRNPATRTGIMAQRTVTLVISEWPFPGPQGPIQSNANITTGGNTGVHWGKMTAQGDMDIKRALVSIPWFNAHDRIHFEYSYPGFGTPPGPIPFVDQYDWLAEVIERDYEDPWYEARARGNILNGGTPADPTPYVKVDQTVDDFTNTPTAGWSNWFQYQAYTNYPDYKEVLFPVINYDFWKEIAVQGASSGQENVFYLRWVAGGTGSKAGEMYTDGTTTKCFAEWVNAARATNPAKPGFYFFDSQNSLNPQGPGAPGVLAPAVDVNSSDDGNDFRMMGFIYLNALSFGSSGVSPPAMWVPFPGEPYRDVGHTQWDVAGGIPIGAAGANNGKWDFQDVNGNLRFDVYVEPDAARKRVSGGGAVDINPDPYLPVPYFAFCVPPNDDNFAGATCSEPHEPYINIVYPPNAKSGGGPEDVPVRWEANGSQTRRAKDTVGGTPVDCTSSANWSLCTSNRWDRDGGMVNDLSLFLDGVFYTEGDYGSTGNAEYFGSLLINGNVNGTGTPEVWFDERLIKGDWPPDEFNFPRVYISAHLTDQ